MLLRLLLLAGTLHAQSIIFPGPIAAGGAGGAPPTPPTVLDSQQTVGASTGTTPALTNTAATALVVFYGCFAQSCDTSAPLTITSIPSNSFTCGTALSAAPSIAGKVCYTLTPAAGATVTVSFSGCMVACWVGAITLSGSGAFDGSFISSANSSTGTLMFQPGSLTTGFANDIVISGVISYCQAPSTQSIDSGYTLTVSTCSGATMDGAIGYKIITAAGATNPQWSFDAGGAGWQDIAGWNIAIKGL